ncbi:polysaccharide deacetylase family protein [Brevibacillus brevis]|uniref:polysaccharide deacetylase family protein n=1 Tax=Brevibacillus brevis TaxID=1393 RepID=UPI00165E2784|nr:polysaccharide deacetylase family protein [Brevibacillus brevis]
MDFAVMYHYVRPRSGWNGIFPLLPEEFEKQIELISKTHNIVHLDELNKKSVKPRCVLTFDDGTRDQYVYAYDILKRKGIPAYFTVMSGPMLTGIIPIFHLVHVILSFKTDEEVWELLSSRYDVSNVEEESSIYHYETNRLRRFNKYVLNFMLSQSESREVLESIFKTIFPDSLSFINNFYLNIADLKEMSQSGMAIGVHCHHHAPYDGNPHEFYKNEIMPCKVFLKETLGINSQWYTPAFGGGNMRERMRNELTPILLENGFKRGFTVNPGLMNGNDEFWINRIDCVQLSPNRSSSINTVIEQYTTNV